MNVVPYSTFMHSNFLLSFHVNVCKWWSILSHIRHAYGSSIKHILSIPFWVRQFVISFRIRKNMRSNLMNGKIRCRLNAFGNVVRSDIIFDSFIFQWIFKSHSNELIKYTLWMIMPMCCFTYSNHSIAYCMPCTFLLHVNTFLKCCVWLFRNIYRLDNFSNDSTKKCEMSKRRIHKWAPPSI